MTDTEIIVAIAEACGVCVPDWRFDGAGHRCAKCGMLDYPASWDKKHPPEPNFCSDLNAMHEAEQLLKSDNNRIADEAGEESDWDAYIWHMEQIIGSTCAEDDLFRLTIHATARQRAEAFLRTIGKWKDDK